jgi:dihydropteroate synthase
MGVLNVTPDSFSDGGCWFGYERAVGHGLSLVRQGADVVDIGGESTRPGASPVDEAEECRRILPVIEAVVDSGVRVSVDTRKEAVAKAAVKAGATLINDVSASLWPVAADEGVGWVAMHMRGEPRTMQVDPSYEDVVTEVRDFLVDRAARASAAGVSEVWIDPGIGFGKTEEHNLRLLRHLDRLVGTGLPVLVGTSRKTFLGRLTAAADGCAGGPTPPDERLEASLASAVWAMTRGAAMLRVHDVRPTTEAVRLAQARMSA